MKTIVTGGLAAAVIGTVLSAVSVAPASAQLARPQTAVALAGDNDLITDVQWRRGGGIGYRGVGGLGWRGAGIGYRGVGWRGAGVGWRGAGVGWRGAGLGWRGYGWRGYGYRPWLGAGLGLAAGAALGGALAAAPYYGDYGYGDYGYGYGPSTVYYYDDIYPYAGGSYGYAAPAGGTYAYAGQAANAMASGDTTAYCMQRYKSFNPATGTYLGYDGRRHPCPR